MTTEGDGTPNGERDGGENDGTQVKKSAEKPHFTSYIEAGCAILLVLITGTYTYYAAGQLHKMKRSTDATEKAANAAAKAAGIADVTLKEIQKGGMDTHELAVQAKNQADVARDSLQSVQRAFVFPGRPRNHSGHQRDNGKRHYLTIRLGKFRHHSHQEHENAF